MGNLSHTVGGTDNLVSFKSAARVPIDSLKVHFSPIQEGEGDPSPTNVRPIRGWNEVEAYKSGKNIARVTGYNAVNTVNADTHNKLSNSYGTTISTNDYSLLDTSVVITQAQVDNEQVPNHYRNGYFCVMVKNLIYGKRYDVSFKITDVKNNPLNCSFDKVVILTPGIGGFFPNEIKDNVLIFKNIPWIRYSEDPTNSSYNRSNFEIRNGGMSFTLSEFMVTPVGMNDGVFEPYCGETIPVTFPVTGKNKFNGEISNVNINYNGQTLTNDNSRMSSSFVSIAHGQYTLSCSENYPVAIYAYDDNGFIANESLVTWQESPTTFVIENAKYVRFKWKKSDDSVFSPSDITNIQLELGSEATSYEPYNPDNTIYGGYVDLVNGEAVEEFRKFVVPLSNLTKTEYDDRNGYEGSVDFGCRIIRNNKQISNIAPYSYNMPNIGPVSHFFVGHVANTSNTVIRIYLSLPKDVDESTIFEFTAKLETPIYHPLTSTQLKTFLNNNAFWSNTNDVTEVSYAIHDTAPIRAARKRIMAASPHIESVSSDLITFNTDVAAPLKECKVYFEPVQDGEGDPSPDNIRPIDGWNNIEVTKCGKNLLRISSDNKIGNSAFMSTVVETETGFSIADSVINGGYWVKVKPNTAYTFSYISTYNGGNMHARVWPVEEKVNDWSQVQINFLVNKTSWTGSDTFTTDENTNWIIVGVYAYGNAFNSILTNMQIEESSSVTSYESYNGVTIPITFPAEAGTIYGGYIDLIKGKLIQEWIQVKINFLSWTYMNSGECFRSQVPMERVGYKEISPVRSSIYETLEVGSTISSWADRKDYSISEHLGNSGDTLIQAIHIKDSRYTTVSDFLNGVGNENIVYKLLTPIEYSITPQTLKTLRGTNNIWSTSNGPISIKYWKH